MTKLCITCCLLAIGFVCGAQNCRCTISEVENNTVNPCNLIIGSVDTVTSKAELRTAIIETNNVGGNRTILIADGTYQIASTAWFPFITASNVVFRSLSGNRDAVILTGEGMRDVAPLVESGFYIVGNNITIADLTIKELGNHGIAGDGDSLFVHNVKIQNTFEQMIKGVSAKGGADDARIQCSLFEYPSGVGPQYYIGGLDIHRGNNWVVNDNIFKNIASPSGSLAEHAIHFWDSSANNTIERNMIINCDRGIGFGLGNSPNDGGIIRNNMIYNDGSSMFDDVGISLETSTHTKVYNNTVFIEYPNAIEYRFKATAAVDISNNLTNKQIKSRDAGSAILTTNYTSAQSGWFVNASDGNLRLNTKQTEVVDKGTQLSDVSVDIDKTARPQGKLFDIGAHEYEQTNGLTHVEQSTSQITVFPNPAKTTFIIQSATGSIGNITVHNLMNQTIASFEGESSSSSIVVDVRTWQPGVYICHVAMGNRNKQIMKIVVSK
ncbi:MAG: hypothetical protein ACI8SE_001288 [Bacteroidia bacterium]|jgi:hypothetical protein